ncbi:MAG: hypothetical protein Kow0090_08070 [Myxococcota bacterium]
MRVRGLNFDFIALSVFIFTFGALNQGCSCEEDISSPPPDPVFSDPSANDDGDGGTNGTNGEAPPPLCADWDGNPKSDCAIKLAESPDEKSSLNFGLVKTNVCGAINLLFENQAGLSRPLQVDSVTFPTNENEAFSLEGYKGLKLKAGEGKIITFKYCPTEGSQATPLYHKGECAITTNNGSFSFELKGSSGMPDLRVRKSYDQSEDPNADPAPFNSETLTFDFGRVGTASPKYKAMELLNYGLTPLRLYEAFLADKDYSIFTVTNFPGVMDISPGITSANTFNLTIECAPQQQIEYNTTLFLVHDDPIGVELTDDFGGATLMTQPLSDVNTLLPGYPQTKTDILDPSLSVTQIPVRCTGGPAGCPVSIPKVLKVSKGTFTEYVPEEGEDNYEYQWLVPAPVLVTLSAEDSWDPEGDQMEYKWTIITEGADRSIPYGSNAGFDGIFGKTDSSLKVTDFAIDVVGTYIVYLQVIDNRGMKCDPVPIKLVSAPSQKVHIELMWSTPMVDLDVHLINTNAKDPDTATLWAIPCDAYWNNRSPDWGIPRVIKPGDDDYPSHCENISTDTTRWQCEYAAFCEEPANQAIQNSCEDDPTLDIDNTHAPRTCTPSEVQKYPELCSLKYERDCYSYLEKLKAERTVTSKEEEEILLLCRVETGPENINIVNPKPGTYLVAVHYFTGVFPSEARVRIYLNGKLQGGGDMVPKDASGAQVKLQNNELWNVAYIDWPQNPNDDPVIRPIGAIYAAPEQQSDLRCELDE